MTVRRLFGFLRPYRGQVIVSALLAIGSQVAVLTIPYLTGRAIDATRAYLDAFDAAVASSKTSAEAQKKVKARFPGAQLDIILQLGADSQFATK